MLNNNTGFIFAPPFPCPVSSRLGHHPHRRPIFILSDSVLHLLGPLPFFVAALCSVDFRSELDIAADHGEDGTSQFLGGFK